MKGRAAIGVCVWHSPNRTAAAYQAWTSGKTALAVFTAEINSARDPDSKKAVLEMVQQFWEGVAAHWLQPTKLDLTQLYPEAAFSAHNTGEKYSLRKVAVCSTP